MIWKMIFEKLKEEGFEVYSPGIHEGDCLRPYVVISRSGSDEHSSFSTNIDYYDVMLYTPKGEYSKIDDLVFNLKMAMTSLEPTIWPAGTEQPTYYDSSVSGYMTSILYKNYKLKPNKFRKE